jgi:hypothetical protein
LQAGVDNRPGLFIFAGERFRIPYTEQRIRRVGTNELRIDYRIEDAGLFTTPWEAVASFHPFRDWDEEICSENNIDPRAGKPVPGMPMDLNPAL